MLSLLSLLAEHELALINLKGYLVIDCIVMLKKTFRKSIRMITKISLRHLIEPNVES